MILTKEQYEYLCNDENYDCGIIHIVEEEDWQDEGKYQTSEVIFKYNDGKFYSYIRCRHGNYYSGYETEEYEYADKDAIEVCKKQVIREEWVSVDKSKNS